MPKLLRDAAVGGRILLYRGRGGGAANKDARRRRTKGDHNGAANAPPFYHKSNIDSNFQETIKSLLNLIYSHSIIRPIGYSILQPSGDCRRDDI